MSQSRPLLRPVTPQQIKKIHTLKSLSGTDESTYREVLRHYGVTTSKDLTFDQAAQLIAAFEEILSQQGKKGGRPKKYDGLGKRAGFATPRQLRKIEVLWAEVSIHKDNPERSRALRTFLLNKFGVSDVRFIRADQVRKVLNALVNFKGDGTRRAGRAKHEREGRF